MADLPGFIGQIGSALGIGGKAASLARGFEEKSKAKPSYPTSPDERRALGFVEEAKRIRLSTIECFEPIWLKCILFTAGIQYVQYLSTTRQFEQVRREDWMPQPAINYIQSKVQRIVDFFTRNAPTAIVSPNSDKETDKISAELAERVRQYLWIRNDDDDSVDEAATWMATVGNAFVRSYYNTSLAQRVRIPRVRLVREPILDGMGQPVLDESLGGIPATTEKWEIERDPMTNAEMYDDVAQGEIDSYVVNPMAMTVPISARKLTPDACPWVMESSIHPTHLIRQLYPDKADYIPEDGIVPSMDLFHQRLTQVLASGLQGAIRAVDPSALQGFCVVNSYERAPEVGQTNGTLIVECNGVPLLIDDLPLQTDYSYTHAGYFRVPGRFWFRGAVEDMIHPQEQINKLEQFLQLNDAYNVNPCWTVPIEAKLARGALGNRPGAVYRHKHPFEPKRIPGQQMPPQVVERRQIYIQDMEEISGVRDVIQGGAPPGVTAGVSLNLLGEQAEGMFSPIEVRWKSFLERWQTKKLMLVQRNYTVPRFLAIEGEDGEIQGIHDFVGSQLLGNVRVKVESGSYRPHSKAAQQQTLLDLVPMGLLPGVLTDPEQLSKLHERLGVSGFDQAQSLDIRRARWENEMLTRSEGWEQVRRQAGDDDVAHYMIHQQLEKSQQWLRLPQTVRQRVTMHVLEHLQAIMMAQAAPDVGREPDVTESGGGGGGADQESDPNAEGEDGQSGESGTMPNEGAAA